MNRWHVIFVLTLLFGGGWVWANRLPVAAQPDVRTPQPAVDHPAPDFILTTLAGDEFNLSENLGQPVVLNFWATWCGPCQRELPTLQAAAERYGARVKIIGIDQGEESQVVQDFVDQFNLTYPIPLDPATNVGEQYQVRGLPTTYFIDPDGTIRQIWMGEMNSITLAEGVAQLLR
ncbi:MAG: TlpA disulfide reductase family protein [Caldilineaceae bacterium]